MVRGKCKSFIALKVELEVYIGVGIQNCNIWLPRSTFKADHLKIVLPKLFFYTWVTNPKEK